MADLVVSSKLVRPLAAPEPQIRDFIAGGAVNVGDLVYIDAAGKVQQANAGAAGTVTSTIGVAISVGSAGGLLAASGDVVSVLIFGAVNGFTVTTIGARLFASNTAGKIADAAGTVAKPVAYTLSADTLFIFPAGTNLA